MSARQMKELREQAKLTQTEMADRMGLGISAYQDLENDDPDWKKFKRRHLLALERASLTLAVERGDITLALPSVRRDALDLARMITGDDGVTRLSAHVFDVGHLGRALVEAEAEAKGLPYKVQFTVDEEKGIIRAQAISESGHVVRGATTGQKVALLMMDPEAGFQRMFGFLRAAMKTDD